MSQLMLLFRVGSERYALATRWVVEIIHRVELSKVHDASTTIAGRFNYHGKIVPVLDVSQLLHRSASRPKLGTRIILVKRERANQMPQLMGLLVEQVSEILEDSQFDPIVEDTGNVQHAYLGKTLVYQQEMIQCLRTSELFSELASDEHLCLENTTLPQPDSKMPDSRMPDSEMAESRMPNSRMSNSKMAESKTEKSKTDKSKMAEAVAG
ncbi:MAG: chemotaxis protein CheW [Phormidesmis sp.]